MSLANYSPYFNDDQQRRAGQWFYQLRQQLCSLFENIETELETAQPAARLAGQPSGSAPSAGRVESKTGTLHDNSIKTSDELTGTNPDSSAPLATGADRPGSPGVGTPSAARFQSKLWERTTHDGSPGGGGVTSVMRGRIFEKVGVNISTVYGRLDPQARQTIEGFAADGSFWASGISVVAHMCSPLVPAAHMNCRYIVTDSSWFGGGADLTFTYPDPETTEQFHLALKECCQAHDPLYYPRFKQWCDRYFYLPHRGEIRGAGGIFFDHLNSGSFDDDFAFIKALGQTFAQIYPTIVRQLCPLSWSWQQRREQLLARGRYVEFNLLYDRGTRFGLMSGGNSEAILMSLPPEVHWE